ncbi:MAG: OsmC family peroxiredoxin, partial [Gammaproteobacteria bacterium]|nr:OsmC family peroxiredoxin [Gammaproteobacteria bacterium]
SASKFDWLRLECAVAGRLDRVERVAQFTQFDLTARLVIPAGADRGRAQQLLEKSKQICLVSNSLKAPCHLQTEITGG